MTKGLLDDNLLMSVKANDWKKFWLKMCKIVMKKKTKPSLSDMGYLKYVILIDRD